MSEVQIVPADYKEAWAHIRAYFSQPYAVLAKEEGSCVYRTTEGHKCAVGCLLTDETYFSYVSEEDVVTDEEEDDWGEAAFSGEGAGARFEGEDVTSMVQYEDLAQIVNGDTAEGQEKLQFLLAAQKLHDNVARDAKHFVDLLDGLVFGYGLELKEYTEVVDQQASR